MLKNDKFIFKKFIFKFFTLISIILTNLDIYSQSIKTVVTIDNIVKELDDNTSCDLTLWANKLENSCKCCLVKYAYLLDQGKSAMDILSLCNTKKRCDSAVIEQLESERNLKDEKNTEDKLKKLINILYESSVIIKEVKPHDIKFDSRGFFNESSVVNFLVESYKNKKLSNPSFKESSCLTAKDILGQKGYQTTQLFLISSTCAGRQNDYILKEIASGTAEIMGLEKSFLIKPFGPYIYPRHIANFPSFIFPIAYISYTYNGKPHYLSLLDRSPGVILSSLAKQYKDKQISSPEVIKIYYEVGVAMSNFHREMMKYFKDKANPEILLNPTYVQGDAHQANIFYDKDTNRTIFIDNEKITWVSPADPFKDIQLFFFTTINNSMFLPPEVRSDRDFINKWLLLTAESFVNGYIDAYPSELRSKVAQELINKFKSSGDYNNYKITIDELADSLYKRNINQSETKPENKNILSKAVDKIEQTIRDVTNNLKNMFSKITRSTK